MAETIYKPIKNCTMTKKKNPIGFFTSLTVNPLPLALPEINPYNAKQMNATPINSGYMG